MKRTVANFFYFIVILGLAGCYLGDRHWLATTVSLNLRGPQEGGVRILSVTDSEVHFPRVIPILLPLTAPRRYGRNASGRVQGQFASETHWDRFA
jgi:hypothetical protein